MAAGVRPGRTMLICLVIGIAVLLGVVGPRLWGDAAARAKTMAVVTRKFERLYDFARFRAPGDKAVLRVGDAKPHAKAKDDATTWVPPRPPRHGLPAPQN